MRRAADPHGVPMDPRQTCRQVSLPIFIDFPAEDPRRHHSFARYCCAAESGHYVPGRDSHMRLPCEAAYREQSRHPPAVFTSGRAKCQVFPRRTECLLWVKTRTIRKRALLDHFYVKVFGRRPGTVPNKRQARWPASENLGRNWVGDGLATAPRPCHRRGSGGRA
jgi:hypothetical protein